MLLRLHGVTPEIDSKRLKRQFEPYVNGAAAVVDHYGQHFNPEFLKSKRHLEKTIDELLKLFKA